MNYLEVARMPEGQALIYRIVNKENGKMYVGSTIEPKRRMQTHFKQLQGGKHHSFILQRAYQIYGANAFEKEALLVCAGKDRDFYETIFIKAAQYNVSRTPLTPSRRGTRHTENTLEKMKSAARKRWAEARRKEYDPKCEEAWRLYLGGVPRYKACKQAGVSHSTFWDWLERNKERVEKEDMKGRKMFRHSVEASNRARHKRVYCPELQCVFFSRVDAGKFFEVRNDYINTVLREGRKIQRKYSLEDWT